jgi:hypothetical protein
MVTRLYRGLLFALYQLTLLVGIAMLPVALVLRQFGLTLPFHRMVQRLGDAYDAASAEPV